MFIDVFDDYVKGTIRQRAKNWGEDETDLLLDLWGSDRILEELGRSKHNHDAIFKQMAHTLQSQGFLRSDIEVRNRMRYLRDYFKRMAKQSVAQQNEDRYYAKLSKIIGYRQQRLSMMQQEDDANNNVIKTASPNLEEGGPVLNPDFNFNFPATGFPPGLMLPSFLQGLRTSLENGARLHNAGQFLFPGLLPHAPMTGMPPTPTDTAHASRPDSLTPPATPLMTTLADISRLANRPLVTSSIPKSFSTAAAHKPMDVNDISPPPSELKNSNEEGNYDIKSGPSPVPPSPPPQEQQNPRKRRLRLAVNSKRRESGIIRAINRLSRRISKLEKRRMSYEERMEERRMSHEKKMVDAMHALLDKVTGPAA